MGRYLHVLKLFWGAAIAAELEYRINFVLATLSSLGNLAGSLFGLFLFYRTGYRFAGYSWEEALVVLGIFTILQGFSSTFLAPNLSRIVDRVQQGTLDFVLLKPISFPILAICKHSFALGNPRFNLRHRIAAVCCQQVGSRNRQLFFNSNTAVIRNYYSLQYMVYVRGHQHLVCQNLQCYRSPQRIVRSG